MNELQYRYIKRKADIEIEDRSYKAKIKEEYKATVNKIYKDISDHIKKGEIYFNISVDYKVPDHMVGEAVYGFRKEGITMDRHWDYDDKGIRFYQIEIT